MFGVFSLIAYILSFFIIWLGAGLIIKSVDKIAEKLKLSAFAVSFFVLGILTSIPEMAISITAVIDKKPEIFVGTLLGGVIVIFLFIIPFLAIVGRGVKITHDLNHRNLILLLIAIATPAFFVIDSRVSNFEGLLLVVFYFIALFIVQIKHGFFEKNHTSIMTAKMYSFFDLLKVILGITLVYVSSQYIVNQTLVYAQELHFEVFYLSLLVLSIGTNLPELSLAVRAIISGKKDIAFGDYLGSASANTLLFGIFTLINDGEVLTSNSFLFTFGTIVVGLSCFYYFAQTKRKISVKEGLFLLGIYGIFIGYEIFKGVTTG